MRYKLFMFGFPAMCIDLDEVRDRLKIYPSERANYEGLDQCYLIDLQTGEQYKIGINETNHFIVLGLT